MGGAKAPGLASEAENHRLDRTVFISGIVFYVWMAAGATLLRTGLSVNGKYDQVRRKGRTVR